MRKIQAQRKMHQQQAQVDEVIGIMHQNVEAVLERDSKLSALEERADALQDGSAQFEKRAGALKNKFWLENLKSMIAMGVVGFILLLLIYWKFFHDDKPQYYYPPPPPPQQGGGGGAAGGGAAGGAGGAAGGTGGGEGGAQNYHETTSLIKIVG